MKLSYPNRQQLLIAGYPRSGNSWTARLLGSILNAPVTGAYATSLAQEGLDRDGPYVVRQLHIKPSYNTSATTVLESERLFSIPLWKTERIIHVVRDPRDVCVSVHFNWKRDNLTETINAVALGQHPLVGLGSWPNHEQQWLDVEDKFPPQLFTNYTTVFYENLLENPYDTLCKALEDLDLPISRSLIRAAIEEQSFAHKKAQIARDGDSRPYGKAVQLTHMRKGIAGDWRNYLTPSQRQLAHDHFQPWLELYGYERNSRWVNENGRDKLC